MFKQRPAKAFSLPYCVWLIIKKQELWKKWRRVWGMIRAEKIKAPRALQFLKVTMRYAWQWPKQPRPILYSFALSICNCGLCSSFWQNRNQFSTLPSALDWLSHFFVTREKFQKNQKVVRLPSRTQNEQDDSTVWTSFVLILFFMTWKRLFISYII